MLLCLTYHLSGLFVHQLWSLLKRLQRSFLWLFQHNMPGFSLSLLISSGYPYYNLLRGICTVSESFKEPRAQIEIAPVTFAFIFPAVLCTQGSDKAPHSGHWLWHWIEINRANVHSPLTFLPVFPRGETISFQRLSLITPGDIYSYCFVWCKNMNICLDFHSTTIKQLLRFNYISSIIKWRIKEDRFCSWGTQNLTKGINKQKQS